MKVIELKDVKKSYGKNEILHGISLDIEAVSYTHLRAHETDSYLVCRLLLEKKKKKKSENKKKKRNSSTRTCHLKTPAIHI